MVGRRFFSFFLFLFFFLFLLLFSSTSEKTRVGRSRAKVAAICLLDASTWGAKLSELVKTSQVSLLPYNLDLDYDYWNYRMYVVEKTRFLSKKQKRKSLKLSNQMT